MPTNMSIRTAFPNKTRKLGLRVLSCIGLTVLWYSESSGAQFYCAKPLSAVELASLMAETPLVPKSEPAVAAVHRSATRDAAPQVGILGVFPRFIGGDPWPEMPIKYFVHSSATAQKRNLELAIAEWQSKTVVRFIQVDEKHARGAPHFVVRGDKTGCFSRGHGYLKGDEAVINLGGRCSAGNAVHELGHRLGLMHEHQRSDRDRYIKFDWKHINNAIKDWPKKDQESKLYNYGYLADLWDEAINWITTNHATDYDLVSIMQYPKEVGGDIGKIFEPTEEGKRSLSTRFGADGARAIGKIGQRDCITQWDADAINTRYKGVR